MRGMTKAGSIAPRLPEQSARSLGAKSKDPFCPFWDRITELLINGGGFAEILYQQRHAVTNPIRLIRSIRLIRLFF
jgi:hypothetical protein